MTDELERVPLARAFNWTAPSDARAPKIEEHNADAATYGAPQKEEFDDTETFREGCICRHCRHARRVIARRLSQQLKEQQ
jgi:hypothetical protein